MAWYHSYVNKQISCNTHCCVWWMREYI
jgi:hypothetical protein